VVASNFAPGTTAADIESVMRSVGGDLQFCRLIAATPTVIAEMGFTDAGDADKVIETFNNKRVSLGRMPYECAEILTSRTGRRQTSARVLQGQQRSRETYCATR
jgi:hypothetical protein